MQTHEFELSVGDAVRIGDRVLTLIDIEDGEVAFRIDVLSRSAYGSELPDAEAADSQAVEGFPLAD